MLLAVLPACNGPPPPAEPLTLPPGEGFAHPSPDRSEAELAQEERAAEEAQRLQAMGLPPQPPDAVKPPAARRDMRYQSLARNYEWPGINTPVAPSRGHDTRLVEKKPDKTSKEPRVAEQEPAPQVLSRIPAPHKAPTITAVPMAPPPPAKKREKPAAPARQEVAEPPLPLLAEKREAPSSPPQAMSTASAAPALTLPQPPPPLPEWRPHGPALAQIPEAPAPSQGAQLVQIPLPPPHGEKAAQDGASAHRTAKAVFHCPNPGRDGVIRCVILASWAPQEADGGLSPVALGALLIVLFALLGGALYDIARHAFHPPPRPPRIFR